MQLGSEAHKELFCRSFMDTHLDYEPEKLPFPKLDTEHLNRLRAIPFWHEALSIERFAGVMVSAFADTIDDPMIKEAIALQGREETRHGRLINHLIRFYDLDVPDVPTKTPPADLRKKFVHFGFEECLDSFFAFGMFGLAKQANYMHEDLFTIFDPILDEEARHIVFFVNWITYTQIKEGRGLNLLRSTHAMWNYGQALLGLIKTFGSSDNQSSFTAKGASTFVDDLTAEQFFEICLQENKNRMSKYDDRLLQPMLLPRLSTIALKTLQLRLRRRSEVARA